MLNLGLSVIMVSKILGNTKPSTTMDIYGHLINERQEEAARIMDELVTPIKVEIFKKNWLFPILAGNLNRFDLQRTAPLFDLRFGSRIDASTHGGNKE
jgi:hypothetical protein